MATYVDLSTLHSPTPRSKPPATWGAQIRENDEWFQANRRQICTSGTRPVGFEGLEIYETDTNRVYIHDGSDWREITRYAAWNTYTPSLVQSGTVTKTVTIGRYIQAGKTVHVVVLLAVTGAGSSSNLVTVSTPVTAAWASDVTCGVGSIFDTSGSASYPARVTMHSTGTFAFSPTNVTTGGFLGAATFTAALASGDSIDFSATFEAA